MSELQNYIPTLWISRIGIEIEVTSVTEFAMPSFMTETAVDPGADAVAAGSLTEVALGRLGRRSHFTVIAFESANAATLIHSSASSTVQARNDALGC